MVNPFGWGIFWRIFDLGFQFQIGRDGYPVRAQIDAFTGSRFFAHEENIVGGGNAQRFQTIVQGRYVAQAVTILRSFLRFDWLEAPVIEIVIAAGHVVRIDQFHEVLLQCAARVVDTVSLLQMT